MRGDLPLREGNQACGARRCAHEVASHRLGLRLVPTTINATEEAGAEADNNDEAEGGCGAREATTAPARGGGASRSQKKECHCDRGRRRRRSAPWICGGEGSSSSRRPSIRIDGAVEVDW